MLHRDDVCAAGRGLSVVIKTQRLADSFHACHNIAAQSLNLPTSFQPSTICHTIRMQWKNLVAFLATTSCLVRALPTATSPPASLAVRHQDLGNHVPSDTPLNNPQRRSGVVSRFSRLRPGDTMMLASGIKIVVHTVIVHSLTGFNRNLPTIGEVTNNLDTMGQTLYLDRAMSLAYSLAAGRRITVAMEWTTGQQLSPNLSQPEFQSIIVAMWRTMLDLTEDFCEAQFDFGGRILSIILRYS